jgi:hypothetical protein
MWNIKTKVIPIIMGAIGTISKLFRQFLSNKPRKHEIKEIQQRATLCTAHTELWNVEVQNLAWEITLHVP